MLFIFVLGKAGVYVTLKGQKMLDTVESKLPRVTGISLPNLRRRHDAVEETLYVNQPPPTPVDVSLGSLDRTKFDVLHGEYNQQSHVDQIINEEMNYENTEVHNAVPNTQPNKLVEHHKEVKFADRVANIDINGERNIEQINSETQQAENKQEKAVTDTEQKEENVEKQVLEEETEKLNELTVDKNTKIEPEAKEVNIDIQQTKTTKDTIEEDAEQEITKSELTESNQVEKDTEHNDYSESNVKENNVVFFVTEDNGEKTESLTDEKGKSGDNKSENGDIEDEDVDSNQVNNATVDTVIRVEVSENEKKEPTEGDEPDRAITSEDFPFTDDKTNDQQDYIV